MAAKIYKILLWVQGLYTLLTALWGLLDIDSFMAVTGPKTDIWLVKTVSVLLVAIAVCLLTAIFVHDRSLPVIILAALCNIGLVGIDFYYALHDVISNIYMLDGLAEITFLIGWLYVLANCKKRKA